MIVPDQPILPACFLVSAYVANMNQINTREFNASAELTELFRRTEAEFLTRLGARVPADVGGEPEVAPTGEEDMELGEFGGVGAPSGKPATGVPPAAASGFGPAVAPAGGEPAVYSEVLLPPTIEPRKGTNPMQKAVEMVHERGTKVRDKTYLRGRKTVRGVLAAEKRSAATKWLRAGRRRTFRQKRAKKNKDAGNSA
jgi:hypothetical protein